MKTFRPERGRAHAYGMRFPGGVADPVLGRAYVRDQAGVVSAVDLDAGRVRWRSGPGLWPVAVVPGDAVVVVRPGRARLEVATLAAGRGDERPLATADLPGWVGPGPELRLSGAVTGDRLRLRWTARAGYRGGAAPSEERLAEAARAAGGTIDVDLRTGELTRTAEPGGDEPAPGMVRIGPYRYELTIPPGAPPTLRATDERTGAVRWELPLGSGPAKGPRPLRP